MDITLIIIICGLVLVFFLFFKLLKSVLKALGVALLVFLIIGVVIGTMVYSDINNFQKLASGKKVILFHDETFKAGVSIPPITNVNDVLIRGSLTHYSESDFVVFNNQYASKSFGNITPTNGILIIVYSDSLKNTSNTDIDGVNISVSKNNFLRIMSSENMSTQEDIITEGLSEEETAKVKQYLSYNFDSAQKVKNFIFYKIIMSANSDLGTFILENVRQKNIDVYPEFVTFKSISFIPLSLKDVTGKLIAEGS